MMYVFKVALAALSVVAPIAHAAQPDETFVVIGRITKIEGYTHIDSPPGTINLNVIYQYRVEIDHVVSADTQPPDSLSATRSMHSAYVAGDAPRVMTIERTGDKFSLADVSFPEQFLCLPPDVVAQDDIQMEAILPGIFIEDQFRRDEDQTCFIISVD